MFYRIEKSSCKLCIAEYGNLVFSYQANHSTNPDQETAVTVFSEQRFDALLTNLGFVLDSGFARL